MKKLIGFVIFVFLIILLGNVSNASSIQSIKMDINIEQNGDAKIKETWICYPTSRNRSLPPIL